MMPKGDVKRIEIRELPFARGSERNAFLLRIIRSGEGGGAAAEGGGAGGGGDDEQQLYVAKELRPRRKGPDDTRWRHRMKRYARLLNETCHHTLTIHFSRIARSFLVPKEAQTNTRRKLKNHFCEIRRES